MGEMRRFIECSITVLLCTNYMYIVRHVLLLYITEKHRMRQIISSEIQFNSIQLITPR